MSKASLFKQDRRWEDFKFCRDFLVETYLSGIYVNCPECNKKLKKYSLHLHLKFYHEKKRDQQCQVSSKNFPEFSNKNFSSKICGKFFLTITMLKQHVKSVHCVTKEFVCDHCSMTFAMKKFIVSHMKRKVRKC